MYCFDGVVKPAGIQSISLLVVLGALGGAGCSRQTPIQAKQEPTAIPVRVAAVLVRQVQRTVEAVGTMYPFDETVISAEVEGRVAEVKADLGDQVAAGQVLVKISDEEQRYVVAENEAQLRMALERLGLSDETQRVKDVRDTSEVRRAQADLFEAQQRYQRARHLFEQKIGARAELDEAEARYQAAQAAYDQAVNQIRNLIQQVERVKASLDLQRKKLRDTTVVAPFSARVKERQVTPGQYVRPNTPLLTLVKIDPIRLRLEIPERMAPWVKTGQIADVSVEAFAARRFHGRIWRVSPTVDQAKRTFVVEALIDNPSAELKPGSYAKARVPTTKVENIKLVPVRAVNYVLGSNKTYVVRDGIIDAREVKIGDRFDEEIEILEGVEAGELVATTQLNRLDTGTRVTVTGKPGQASQSRQPLRNSD
ncbi:MAG: efflux RND transporter periplasmic adaptor subunit [Acidobacteria bacterium]|nr:efflux RND transporter periplasmic adaptor subunit [Acidobacteriota bacterium]